MMKPLVMLALTLILAAPLAAQQPPPQPAPKAPAAAQDGFLPVDTPVAPGDVMPAPRLVAIAYGFIWLVIFGYVWSVRSRLSHVERELEAVSRRVPSRK